MTIEVGNLRIRRNDDRWNRVSVGDVIERVTREPMRQWVLSVPFALRYLFATAPAVMGQVLGIVYRAIASHLIKVAGYYQATAQTGAVILIERARPCAHPTGDRRSSRSAVLPICQRFGSALNLNFHFHILFLDGVTVTTGKQLTFRRVSPPTVAALEKWVHVISKGPGQNYLVNTEGVPEWLQQGAIRGQ